MMKWFTMLCATLIATTWVAAASAEVIQYSTALKSEVPPPDTSPGTGSATVTVDTTANTLRLQTTFSGLVGTVTAAHIHCCTEVPLQGNVGVATTTPTFPGFPSGVTAGSYDMTFDLTQASSYNAAFVTANGGSVDNARAALLAGLNSGSAYLNIHTSSFGSGEIRGFPRVPEPSALTLLLSGLAAVGLVRRK
jgi:hypothetical protein